MQVQKTIKSKIVGLTNRKKEALEKEYHRLQDLLELERKGLDFLPLYDKIKSELYSANVQQALRYYKNRNDREYPISMRKDLIDIEVTDNEVSKYWLKARVGSVYGGVNVPIKPHKQIPEDVEYCESKIIKKDGDFYFYLTVKNTVEERQNYDGVLAVDIGQKYIGVSVASHRERPKFQGRDIRGIRRHYNWLRKKLGKKKLEKEVERLSDKERRKVNQRLHEIARDLVEEADEHNEVIAIGNLKGLREESGDKGRTFNRIISNFPYERFTQYIRYKANERGIRVVKVSEHYTSITCSKCGSRGKRVNQGTFKCPNCGYEINADFNGAKNIFKKVKKDLALGDVPKVGALSGQAHNSSEMVSTSASVSGETEKGSPFLTNNLEMKFPNLKTHGFQEVS